MGRKGKKTPAGSMATDAGQLKATGMVMAIGNILAGDTPAQRVAWKLRMLKAGTPPGALSLPDDWDSLTDEVKEARLDKISAMFRDVTDKPKTDEN